MICEHGSLKRQCEMCDLLAILKEKDARIAELQGALDRALKDTFSLAATQCHDGYADDGGNWRCKYQDEIAKLEKVAEAARKALTITGHAASNYLSLPQPNWAQEIHENLCQVLRSLEGKEG